jgi:hypothetical protein
MKAHDSLLSPRDRIREALAFLAGETDRDSYDEATGKATLAEFDSVMDWEDEMLAASNGRPIKGKHGKAIESPVTVDRLKRHEKRYGMECIGETAREHSLGDAELLELGVAGDTGDRVRALVAQGFVPAEIAKRLNLGLPTVRRHAGQGA